MENKSINELMGSAFSNATGETSYLIKRVEELCNTPISEFEIEDFRLLINQGIALNYLVSPAIDILSNNLFAEGDYYEGELLKSILTINESIWKEQPNLKEKLKQILLKDFYIIETLGLSDSIKMSLNDLVKSFRGD
jgi:hypothetical protein